MFCQHGQYFVYTHLILALFWPNIADKGGVFALWAGIANQRGNPYFNIGGVVANTTSQEWLEGYFS